MSYERTYERINWEDYSSTNTPINAANLNKMDYTLEQLDIAMAESGGGGGGTSDYHQLSNKPRINGVELDYNITSEDLGIVVPQYTSELENDSGFITSETDPTVPAWAKQPTKPTYTAAEVGALPSDTPIPDPTSVVVDKLVSVGTHIADITVNGEKTELYAPTGGGGGGVSSYGELPDKPSINGHTLVGDMTSEELGINSVTDEEKATWNAKANVSDIPTELADLGADETHRLVTDAEKSNWNAKASQSSVDELTRIVGNANELLEGV